MKLITFINKGPYSLFSAFIMKKNNKATQSWYDTKWLLNKIHTQAGLQEVLTKAFIKFDEEKKSAGGNAIYNSFGNNFITNNNNIILKNIFPIKM